MTDRQQGAALAVVTGKSAAPTMSETLKQWLASQGVSTLGGNEDAHQIIELDADEIHDMWKLCDYFDQVEMAARVAQGYCLARIRASSDRDFVEGLKQRDTQISSAYQLIDTYKLFVTFPNLALMDRAAALGFARMRELKPHLGIDGIRALIEGKEVDTLTYDAAVAMTKREIVAWRKARFTAMLERDAAKRGEELPQVEHAPDRTRALEVATDELLGASRRAQLELDRAKAVVTALLPPGTDEWKAARVELAHSVRLVLHAIIEQAQALDADLHIRFGVASVAPLAGEYHTLPFSRIRECGELVEQQAELNTLQRSMGRQKRLKCRGAPPKTLEAVIAQALHVDHD